MITRTDPGQILAGARAAKIAEHAAAAVILDLAARWADLHPVDTIADAATLHCRGEDLGVPVAGTGAPLVDDRCVAEFAAAVHTTTEGGQRLIGEALELRHRLPRLWALVHAAKVPPWQAQRVADRTMHLTVEAATFVDAQVSAFTGRIGPARLDKLIDAAIAAFMPEEAERRHAERSEHRRFTITPNTGQDGLSGQAYVDGLLDLADAVDLETAIADQARLLGELGCTDSLDVRRARAAGDLARRQPVLDLGATNNTATGSAARDSAAGDSAAGDTHPGAAAPVRVPGLPQRQRVVLYLHLAADALTGGARVGRIHNTQTPVTAVQIRDWCGHPDVHLIVKPVIDLNDTISVHGYEVPDRIREHLALRDVTCVFPWCDKTAHPAAARMSRDGAPVFSTDADHIEPFDPDGPPGQTSTDNLAPLCRRHHRLKTFTGWRYRVHDRPGSYRWTSPHGLTFIRDHTGTRQAEHDLTSCRPA